MLERFCPMRFKNTSDPLRGVSSALPFAAFAMVNCVP